MNTVLTSAKSELVSSEFVPTDLKDRVSNRERQTDKQVQPGSTNFGGFFDLQVNGYGGVDFNQNALNADELHRACELLEAHGVGGILATIGTESQEVMLHRLANLVTLREQDPLAKRLIVGIHIEGPFISPKHGYIGAHPADAVRDANLDEMKQMLDAAGGLTRLVTLAPEHDRDNRVTHFLSNQRVVISAGHCDTSLDALRSAIDAGLSMFTHVGNGCPMNMNRHDNIIQRALSLYEHLWLCFIADGAHVPFFTLKNYLKAVGVERSIVVTDAVAPAGLGPGTYTVSRWQIDIGEDMVARSPDNSHLIGAAITMQQSFDNLINGVGLTRQDALALTIQNPLAALGQSTLSETSEMASGSVVT